MSCCMWQSPSSLVRLSSSTYRQNIAVVVHKFSFSSLDPRDESSQAQLSACAWGCGCGDHRRFRSESQWLMYMHESPYPTSMPRCRLLRAVQQRFGKTSLSIRGMYEAAMASPGNTIRELSGIILRTVTTVMFACHLLWSAHHFNTSERIMFSVS